MGQKTEAMNRPAESPEAYLERLGQAGDGPHDIATAGLMLAAMDRPERPRDVFTDHLDELAQLARGEAEFARDAEIAARALSRIMVQGFGYEGAHSHYDDPDNADLMSVIQRRRGLPVALGILYMHAARAAGFSAQGLATPGHFLLVLGVRGGEAVIDPFNGGAAVERERLSSPPLLAELGVAEEPNALEPVSDTDVLLRLQNNIKMRALAARDTKRAIDVLMRMLLIAPKRTYFWFELGRLHESIGALGAARAAYEHCLTPTADIASSNEAALALQTLKRRLN
jgi:regulator of sirC expression with transglutaminase-like and TPR domain